ncbi:MAG: hypothetical protein H6967_08005 [Chromatiaceae bacterium]|nr:hypothetical protein [Chromatiaceae bacterium]
MKRKKLLKRIAGWLDREGQKQRDHKDELEVLLEKLSKKEAGLEQKLSKEKNKNKQKRLSTELAIVRAQRGKGEQVLANLSEEQDS